ncbi:TolC family protein [Pseudomaricurvus alkylphenolicus]|jgi:outer membrane protein TolC|uniref:TolC family protein n=1 Tax=Pseudomaricurvus alkylphenolicus TaxID=1306991 RepID=UPI00141F95F5|nr:TolC family protein [Pseudomaricurvus alkylphenolicus]NIB44507.1 TolC family protein [Pseudomaricurvus alkylphenolicus]
MFVKPMLAKRVFTVAVAAFLGAGMVPLSLAEDLHGASFSLTQGSLVKEAIRRNAGAVFKQLDWQVSGEKTEFERGIFEPELSVTVNWHDLNVPNTVEESLYRVGSGGNYTEEALTYDASVKGLLSTGGQVSFGVNGTERESILIDARDNYDTEYVYGLKLTFRQPILKGFGSDITKARIHVAEADQEIAFQEYRQRIMEVAGTAIKAYWGLFGAQNIQASLQRSMEVAERIRHDVEERVRLGKAARTELMEAEIGVSLRQSELMGATADVTEMQNSILTLLNISTLSNPDIDFNAVESPEVANVEMPVLDESLKRALEHWPALKIAQQKQERERIQSVYAENQSLPQLDFTMSYNTAGLDGIRDDAFDGALTDDHESWYAGLEFSSPLLGNKKAKSQYNVAKLRQHQANLEVASVQRNLANDLSTKIMRLRSAAEQLKIRTVEVKSRQKLLNIEMERLRAGKSSIREVLDQEEDLIEYQRNYVSSVVELKLAEAVVELAEGRLMERYNIKLSRDEIKLLQR